MIAHTKNNISYISCTAEGCEKKFKLERRMKRHFESAHALHKCTFEGCELAFNKKRKMKRHLETHNDGKYLKCTYDGCTSTFSRRRNLLRHLNNHEKEFSCTIVGCEVVVKSWSEYRKHLKTHNKIHCKECDVVCPDETAFKSHCKDAHHLPQSIKMNQMDCPYEGCTKTYSRGSNLNQHIRSCHNGRRFNCEIEGCGKQFRHKASLKEHMDSHKAPVKKTKKKRKRKSLAAKLAKYNGELCDLPVTYVDPNDDKALVSVSDKTPNQECYYVSTDSLSRKGENEERESIEDTTVCPKTAPNNLIERLQMVIKDSRYHVNDSCSAESNSDNDFSNEHTRTRVLECSASS